MGVVVAVAPNAGVVVVRAVAPNPGVVVTAFEPNRGVIVVVVVEPKAGVVVVAPKVGVIVVAPKAGVVIVAPKAGVVVVAPKVGVVVAVAPKAGVIVVAPKAGVVVAVAPKTGVIVAAPKAGVVAAVAPKAGVILVAPKAGVAAAVAPKTGVVIFAPVVPNAGAVSDPNAGNTGRGVVLTTPKGLAEAAPTVFDGFALNNDAPTPGVVAPNARTIGAPPVVTAAPPVVTGAPPVVTGVPPVVAAAPKEKLNAGADAGAVFAATLPPNSNVGLTDPKAGTGAVTAAGSTPNPNAGGAAVGALAKTDVAVVVVVAAAVVVMVAVGATRLPKTGMPDPNEGLTEPGLVSKPNAGCAFAAAVAEEVERGAPKPENGFEVLPPARLVVPGAPLGFAVAVEPAAKRVVAGRLEAAVTAAVPNLNAGAPLVVEDGATNGVAVAVVTTPGDALGCEAFPSKQNVTFDGLAGEDDGAARGARVSVTSIAGELRWGVDTVAGIGLGTGAGLPKSGALDEPPIACLPKENVAPTPLVEVVGTANPDLKDSWQAGVRGDGDWSTLVVCPGERYQHCLKYR